MGMGTDTEMDVAIGKLTLAQINLIYRHLPIDLTFVDENDIVKFYTDTPVRVFSRSAGVIGRKVQNCHPREILPVVNRILDSYKSGENDTAEFFINKPGKQIFVNYLAVRDEYGSGSGNGGERWRRRKYVGDIMRYHSPPGAPSISLPEGIPFTAFSKVQASFQSGAVCDDEPGGRFPNHRGKRRLYGRRAAWENKRGNNKEK